MISSPQPLFLFFTGSRMLPGPMSASREDTQHGCDRLIVVFEVLLSRSAPVTREEVRLGADAESPSLDLLAAELVNQRLDELADIVRPHLEVGRWLRIAVLVPRRFSTHCRRDVIENDPWRKSAFPDSLEQLDGLGKITDGLAVVVNATKIIVFGQVLPSQKADAIDVPGNRVEPVE